jgi:hypothetical protein
VTSGLSPDTLQTPFLVYQYTSTSTTPVNEGTGQRVLLFFLKKDDYNFLVHVR